MVIMNAFELRKYLEIKRLDNNCINIRVKGSSMEPLLKEGDCTQIEPDFEIILGIYVFVFRHFIRIHRLIDIINGVLVFKGDNSRGIELVQERMVIGLVEKIYREGKVVMTSKDLFNLSITELSKQMEVFYR